MNRRELLDALAALTDDEYNQLSRDAGHENRGTAATRESIGAKTGQLAGLIATTNGNGYPVAPAEHTEEPNA